MSVILSSRMIQYFSKTDGRDKLAKVFQNYYKFLSWYYLVKLNNIKLSNKSQTISKKLSEFRSLLKFFRWLVNVRDISDLYRKDERTLIDYLEYGANIGDFGYRFFDNVEYLSKYKILPFDPLHSEQISETFQFWGSFFSVLIDLLHLKHQNTDSHYHNLDENKQTYEKKRKDSLLLELIRDLADLLRVVPSVGYFPRIPKHKGIQGVLGGIAGVIGVYQVWISCR